jgi:hypothetical protein
MLNDSTCKLPTDEAETKRVSSFPHSFLALPRLKTTIAKSEYDFLLQT